MIKLTLKKGERSAVIYEFVKREYHGKAYYDLYKHVEGGRFYKKPQHVTISPENLEEFKAFLLRIVEEDFEDKAADKEEEEIF